MIYIKIFIGIIFLNVSLLSQNSDILNVAKSEINRSFVELKKQANPAYFISYGITDIKRVNLSSTLGKIVRLDSSQSRILDIDLRVGSKKLDNTHTMKSEGMFFFVDRSSYTLPIENEKKAIEKQIWFSTDLAYKSAIESYDKILTNVKVKVTEEDTSDDFSYYPPQKYSEKLIENNIDLNKWKSIINRVSALFNKDPKIYFSQVSISIENLNKYFVNTEGSEIQQSQPTIRLFISASTKAEDGMDLPLYESYFAFNESQMPNEEILTKAANNIIVLLGKIREAPMMSTYSGPGILSGEAAGVFFHEIFGHRIEGQRLKDPDDAQTFKNSINQKIISDIINVSFDPTLNELNGNLISGYYKYDDEGVKSQRVNIVENGIFKNYLMSRAPIQGFEQSNGHGRRQAGYKAVSRQSNLIISSNKVVSTQELRNMLIAEAKKQGKDFGLYFVQVQGGFTFTGRSIPNSFNVNPLLVYKVYTDGRPDEIVRGVDLIGTPLTSFSQISAAADDLGVFNGICGAESGGVPVSASSPSLLIDKIEVQKQSKSQSKTPILDHPTASNSNIK